MIRRVIINNYRCIREATIDFAPLTVLVGPNASGKSTVLAAIAPQRGFSGREFWQLRQDLPPSVQGIREEGNWGNAANNFTIRPYSFATIHLDVARARQNNTLAPAAQLDPDGGNLANVFHALTRKQQSELSRELCRLAPMFADVDTEAIQSGLHRLRYQDRWNDNVWYAPDEVSDGTILLTAFLTLQFQQPPLDLLCIEEPERGVHPYLLGQLVAVLRRMTSGEMAGRKTQIVLATHSAELLEFIEPHEVRLLSRDASDGALKVRTIDADTDDWRTAYREYDESLGGLWLSGGLGGVPGGE